MVLYGKFTIQRVSDFNNFWNIAYYKKNLFIPPEGRKNKIK